MNKIARAAYIIAVLVLLAATTVVILALLKPLPIEATVVVAPADSATLLPVVAHDADLPRQVDGSTDVPEDAQTGVVSEAQLVIAQTERFLVLAAPDFGTRVASGEALTVRTGESYTIAPGSVALITFQDGSTVAVDGGTTFSIEELQTDEQLYRVRLRLSAGRIFCRVQKLLGINDVFEVSTPSSVAAVRGTAFGVEVISERATYYYTLEGTIVVRMGDQEAEVHAGEELAARFGAPLEVSPLDPALLAAEPEPPAAEPTVEEIISAGEPAAADEPAADAASGSEPASGGEDAAGDDPAAEDACAAGIAAFGVGEGRLLCDLAAEYNVPPDQVFALRSTGLGVGNVRAALDLTVKYDITVDQIIAKLNAGKSLADIEKELREK